MLRQTRIRRRLGFEYIKPRASHVPALERRKQCRFVHELAARAIHDPNATFRQRESLGIDQVFGFGCQRAVQADEIAGAQHLFERQQTNILLRGQHGRNIGIVSDDCHLMRLRQARNFRPDRPEPNQAQRFVAQFSPGEFFLIPLACLHRSVSLRDWVRHRQQ